MLWGKYHYKQNLAETKCKNTSRKKTSISVKNAAGEFYQMGFLKLAFSYLLDYICTKYDG